jgi:hypothetical protein
MPEEQLTRVCGRSDLSLRAYTLQNKLCHASSPRGVERGEAGESWYRQS